MSDEQKPFEKPGKHADEITIRFEDDENLYVSKAFLGYVSPVFHTMFQGVFKEAKTSEVDIKDISRADFLEFLLCCDPGTMKDVTGENASRLVTIAHKYEARALENRCKNCMDKALRKYLKLVSPNSSYHFKEYETTELYISLQILQMATSFNWTETENEAIKFIAKFPSFYYQSLCKPRPNPGSFNTPIPDDVAKFVEMFNGIPVETQMRVLKARLQLKDDWE